MVLKKIEPILKIMDLSPGLYIFVTVGDQKLHGSSPADASRVLQWINYADNEIVPASCTWVFPCLGIMQFNKQVFIVSQNLV